MTKKHREPFTDLEILRSIRRTEENLNRSIRKWEHEMSLTKASLTNRQYRKSKPNWIQLFPST